MENDGIIELDYEKIIVHLKVPLTPSLNEILRWTRTNNVWNIMKHRQHQQVAVDACMRQTFGSGWQTGAPYAERVRLHVIRCTHTGKFLDQTNLIGGLKPTEDAMVTAGIMPNDTTKHTEWGKLIQIHLQKSGEYRTPATHIFVERIE